MGQMKNYLLVFIMISLWISSASAEPRAFKDVDYSFSPEELSTTKNSFQFFRTFVDLFYLVYQANRENMSVVPSLTTTNGWCVGDAHPENFGFLVLRNRDVIFTMNDMDDSGPCPVILDLYRLMVSARLKGIEMAEPSLLSSYMRGLSGQQISLPSFLRRIKSKATKRGFKPDSDEVRGAKIVRDEDNQPVDDSIRVELARLVGRMKSELGDLHAIDQVERVRWSGGSGGLKRFEVLAIGPSGPVLIEFKEQIRPAISPVSSDLPSTADRIAQTLRFDQGDSASAIYQVVQLGEREMLVRPRFGGNLGLDLGHLNEADLPKLLIYVAAILGHIHARSLRDPMTWSKKVAAVDQDTLKSEVEEMTSYFLWKFRSLVP